MLQLSLCVSGIKKEMLDSFRQELKVYITNKRGSFSVYEKDDFLYYLIAAQNEEKTGIEKVLKQKIAQLIINSFKLKMVENSLKYEFMHDVKYYALVEALVNFDRACDEMYIMQKLDFSSGELYLQSFYYFCCGILREKWMQLIQITNQNSHFLDVQENYLEVLRFLLDGIDKKPAINIEVKNNKLKVKKDGEIILFANYKELISYIIKNNPKSIRLKNVDKTFAEFIKQLFLTRVTLSM